jgi:hypothetical protein
MTDSKHSDTPVTADYWAVRFTWKATQAGVKFPPFTFDQRPMDRQEATRYAQSEWSRRHPGLVIVAAHIRALPSGEWVAVEPASLCGAIDIATGRPVICRTAPEVDDLDDGEEPLPVVPARSFANLSGPGRLVPAVIRPVPSGTIQRPKDTTHDQF